MLSIGLRNISLCAMSLALLALPAAAQNLPSPSYKDVTLNTMKIGPAQTAIGQLGQISAPYTASQLNTNQDPFRVVSGTFPTTSEFPNLLSNHMTQSVVGAVAIPAGTYSGSASWPDAGIAGYATTANINKTAVGVYGTSGISVTGGFGEAFNGVSNNCLLYDSSCKAGGGLNFAHQYTFESDTNLNSPVSGALTGDVNGYLAFISGDANTTNSALAFRAAQQGASKWGYAFGSDNGSATTFALVGAQGTVGPSNGQTLLFKAIGGTGPIGSGGTDILSQIQFVSDGTLRIGAPTAIILNSPVKDTSSFGAASYYVGATADVSCPAGTVSLASLTITNGLVTHC